VTFILDAPEGAKGIVAGVHDARHPGVIQLMAMWVHPAIRGSGAADLLVAAVLEWAKSEDARLVRLQVIAANDRARRVYERNGFRPTTDQFIRERDGQIEMQMEHLIVRN
jgi:GNAT superfamily N-acetyltransferase